jgi:DNA-binding XRE family transcriptional regulator
MRIGDVNAKSSNKRIRLSALDCIAIGERIRNARKSRGMTQAELGAALSVGKATVSNWESGRTMPSFDLFVVLCRELKRTLDWIVTGVRRSRATRIERGATEAAVAPDHPPGSAGVGPADPCFLRENI